MSPRPSAPASAQQACDGSGARQQLAPAPRGPWIARHGVGQFGMPMSWLEDEDGHIIVRTQATCAHCGHRGYDVNNWKITDHVQARWLRKPPVRLADLPAAVRSAQPTCASCRRALTQSLVEHPLAAAGVIVAVGVDQTGRCLFVSSEDVAECIGDGRIELCRDEGGDPVPLLRRHVHGLRIVPEE